MREERWGGLDCLVTGGNDGRGGGDGTIVVLLHGFGAPGDDLVPIAGELDVPRGVRFVFPAAPLDLGDAAYGGRAWWMIDMERIQLDRASGRPRELGEDPPEGLPDARAKVIAMLDELSGALGPAPLVLGGFSQGAMLSCDVALRSPRPLAGLVLLSGTLLTPVDWQAALPPKKTLPVFMSHGKSDPILPFAYSVRLRDMWRAAGAEVDWVEFAGGHEIPRPVLAGAARLITRVADGARAG